MNRCRSCAGWELQQCDQSAVAGRDARLSAVHEVTRYARHYRYRWCIQTTIET